jgi:hypothetical protein
MTITQFFRLADMLDNQPANVRRVAEAMAAGDKQTAANLAGGRFTDDWWAAEAIVVRLADHGLEMPKPTRTASQPANLFSN